MIFWSSDTQKKVPKDYLEQVFKKYGIISHKNCKVNLKFENIKVLLKAR